jgi:hypothetical protein
VRGDERRNIKVAIRVFEELLRYRILAFSKHIGEDGVDLDIADRETILSPVLLSGCKIGQFYILLWHEKTIIM